MDVKAILFDTRSIQKYIFSGNKLKTNIGASYIVEQLFQKMLVEDILCSKYPDINASIWNRQTDINMKKNLSVKCEVAYIGGGNALILFNPDIGDDVIKGIVSEFSEQLLVKAPGLCIGAAIGIVTLLGDDDNAFQESLDKMYGQLKHYQNIINPQVNISYTGLTVPCSINGEVAQLVDREHLLGREARFVSAEAVTKVKYAEAANKALRDKFAPQMADGERTYTFPMELENLGQIETHDYIAIVHIDGNNMGVKFSECKNLQERKKLSIHVADACRASFAKLLESITAEYDTYMAGEHFAVREDAAGANYLPIRPLILGGDDVTFVCHGDMALRYTRRYIEWMEKQGIDCCGGIAILPASYPFFRGYELAEQLCGAAKQKSRTEKLKKKIKLSSWLDFAILHGEQAPELEQIRNREYRNCYGDNMHFGPYKVNDKDNHFSVDKLLEGIDKLRRSVKSTQKNGEQLENNKGLAHNKIKEMRNILGTGRHEIARFMEQLRAQGKRLPVVDKWEVYNDNLWYKSAGEGSNKTPYLDMIEMMEYTF